MKSKTVVAFACFCGAIVTLACSKPSSFEQYVSTAEASREQAYVFSLDLRDSLLSYSIDFQVFMSPEAEVLEQFDGLVSGIRLISPSGKVYEDGKMFSKTDFVQKKPYRAILKSAYQQNFHLAENGVWTLKFTLPPKELRLYNIDGVGLSLGSK